MASYPDSIFEPRETENLPGREYDASDKQTGYAEDYSIPAAEIVAIEETIGENPQGDFDTVVERMDAVDEFLEQPISTEQAILSGLGSSWIATVCNKLPIDITSAASWASSRCYIMAIYIRKATTITGVTWWQQQTGTYTATNYNGIALCTFSGGVLTVVASCSNDSNIWATGFQQWVKKAFTTPYNATPGVYFIMAIYSRSAASVAPTFGYAGSVQNAGDMKVDFPNSRLLIGGSAGVTSLPTTKNFSDFIAETNKWFFGVY